MIPRLVAITPGGTVDPAGWLGRLGEAGVRGVLIRGVTHPTRWVACARSAGFTLVFVHASVAGALDAGGDGIHLPDDDRPPPPSVQWSRSTHSPEAARAVLASGAAFTALSPIWSPTSKPGDRRPTLGIGGLTAAGPGPVLALGGVDPARLRALRAAGGYGALVLGALAYGEPSIARELVEAAR